MKKKTILNSNLFLSLKAFNFLAYLTISIAMSLVFSLAFESSFVQLEKILFGRISSESKRGGEEKSRKDVENKSQVSPHVEVSYINTYPNIEENTDEIQKKFDEHFNHQL